MKLKVVNTTYICENEKFILHTLLRKADTSVYYIDKNGDYLKVAFTNKVHKYKNICTIVNATPQ